MIHTFYFGTGWAETRAISPRSTPTEQPVAGWYAFVPPGQPVPLHTDVFRGNDFDGTSCRLLRAGAYVRHLTRGNGDLLLDVWVESAGTRSHGCPPSR